MKINPLLIRYLKYSLIISAVIFIFTSAQFILVMDDYKIFFETGEAGCKIAFVPFPGSDIGICNRNRRRIFNYLAYICVK